MNFLFELFFCPQHGIFRAENLAMACASLQTCRFHLGYALRRAGLL